MSSRDLPFPGGEDGLALGIKLGELVRFRTQARAYSPQLRVANRRGAVYDKWLEKEAKSV
jgi:hypothetical protein